MVLEFEVLFFEKKESDGMTNVHFLTQH